jgi:hypothetical protein
MLYVTHHFAHLETLSIARRWLVQLGIEPSHIETHTHGIPRIAVAVRPEEAYEVEMVINAAELTDPDSWPSFWDVAQQPHVYPPRVEQTTEHPAPHAHATPIGWHPEDRNNPEPPDRTSILDVSSRFE